MSIVFVNTRAQAELLFQALWRLNDDALPIALHHGSPKGLTQMNSDTPA